MIGEEEREALKSYFKNRKEIAFAFLFGSQAKGEATKLSDVDLAVYFYPEKRRPIEYEEKKFYAVEEEIWSELEKLLNKEVELLVLNRIPASIAASAIRGIPLVIKDWGLYIDFMEAITDEAEDFMEFIVKDYKERIELEKRS
ncbi:MAG: hypothetical protein DRG25_06215 [Deltaproteobacteria bacterium]|nr:MAG: hypothetical protein DRG25_06215 [Deltaproteobacteria bacterium]